MTPFRSILVAADFSEPSREAFRVACSLAHEKNTQVFVLNVLEPKYEVETPVYLGHQTIDYSRAARSPSEHDSVKRRLQEDYAPDRPLDVAYRTTEGDAAEQIVHFGQETGCDLVVMGTHGRAGLRRLMSGSVAESVLRQARCPVLALREPKVPGAVCQDQLILHPTDFSECSRAALRVARGLAQARGGKLVILHVMPLETAIYGTIPAPFDIPAVRDSLTSLASEVDGPDLKHRVGTILAQGDAAAEIVRVADEKAGCGLIVMGTHGRSGIGRLLMGSVAESVLRKAGCPILAVKMSHPEVSPTSGEPCAGGVSASHQHRGA